MIISVGKTALSKKKSYTNNEGNASVRHTNTRAHADVSRSFSCLGEIIKSIQSHVIIVMRQTNAITNRIFAFEMQTGCARKMCTKYSDE